MGSFKKWNTKTAADKTLANLMNHMRAKHHALLQVGALSIRDSELSHANMLQNLTSHQDKLAYEMNECLDTTL